ncbi:hypothetical protein DH2020_021102 [Rehmannia glutinosa]|uniref:Peptidase M3A/M3B catalytic domain-containing protein n=1 Tax=Rehmannia glutinosa TaxID=99300 RepID=A0ABR0WDA6_REHGL
MFLHNLSLMESIQNPLLQDFIFPPYDVIEANHIRPAIQSLLINLVISCLGIVNHLSSVKDCAEIRAAIAEVQLKEAVLYGVSLEDSKRERFNEIEQTLQKLEKVIKDKKEIEGLPSTTLAIAAEMAISKGYEKATADNGPWVITFDGPIYRSVLQHACNRSLREEVYRAYVTRASDGPLNNTPIIEHILELRLEKAKLLGHSNYAEFSFETKMATIDKAKDLIDKLHNASWSPAIQDMEDLRDFARGQGAEEANDLNHWDINFWSERLRESKYDLNEIWNKDVSFYKVKDSSTTPIAYFYFDPYTRPSEKRGGAWMDVVVGRSSVLSSDNNCPRLPIAQIVCNQTPPTGDKPSLMTIREVEAVFHEFGHALQHMLTKQDEGLVSGNQGIEWDAVEIPSLFMENWCYQRDTILAIAKHYESGETLPEDKCLRILSARTFRQLRYACVDLELHSSYVPGGPESIYDVDQKIGKKTHPIPLLPEDRFLCSFSHIFAEVLSADAFSAFEEAGLDNDQSLKEMGYKFRETILALGGGKSPNEVLHNVALDCLSRFSWSFGTEPTPNAFLRYNGLLPIIVA